jgi:hypothetical protein
MPHEAEDDILQTNMLATRKLCWFCCKSLASRARALRAADLRAHRYDHCRAGPDVESRLSPTWGSAPDPIDIDQLVRHGWESDENCERWWKAGEPETVYTFEEAVAIYAEALDCDD